MEDLTFGEQVKIILSRKEMTIKELAEQIAEATGKKMSRQNLTQRLKRDNFQEQDMRVIAAILGCPFQLSIFPLENETGQKVEPREELLLKYVKHPRVQPKRKKADLEDGVYQQVLVFDEEPAAETAAVQPPAEEAERDPQSAPDPSAQEGNWDSAERDPQSLPGQSAQEGTPDSESLLDGSAQEGAPDPENAPDQPAREGTPDSQSVLDGAAQEEAPDPESAPEQPAREAAADWEHDPDQTSEETETDPEEDLLDLELLDPEDSEDLEDMEDLETIEIAYDAEQSENTDTSDSLYKTRRFDKNEILAAAEQAEEENGDIGEEAPDMEMTDPAEEEQDLTGPAEEERNLTGLAAEERDLTIGELYMIHKELDELEETINPRQEPDLDESAMMPQYEPMPEFQMEEEEDPEPGDFEPVIRYEDAEENLELGEMNPYTGREYQTNSVRMHPSRIGYVQVYDRFQHGWTDMTEWAFLGYQERKKTLLGRDYEPPIYLD